MISGLVGDWTMVFVAHGAMLILAGGVALLLASFKELHKPTVFFGDDEDDEQDNSIQCQ